MDRRIRGSHARHSESGRITDVDALLADAGRGRRRVGAASRAPYRLLEEAPELSVGDAESDVQPLVESLEAAVLRWRAA